MPRFLLWKNGITIWAHILPLPPTNSFVPTSFSLRTVRKTHLAVLLPFTPWLKGKALLSANLFHPPDPESVSLTYKFLPNYFVF